MDEIKQQDVSKVNTQTSGRIEKCWPAERITDLTRRRPLKVGPVIYEKERKFLMALFKKDWHISHGIESNPQMFYSAEVKICLLKTLKQHQCKDVVSSKNLDFGNELQQP